jgi:hypothetical protein
MRAEFLTPVIAILTLAAAGPATAADPAAAPAAAADAAAAPAAPAGPTFSATMTGANEVDNSGAGSKGDLKGNASFTARVDKGQLCYKLSWKGVDDPTMAHIHKGVAGSNGPVYIGLSDFDNGGEHCEDLDKERLDALTAHPEDYYVNIHNGDFPGGALRGQLTKQ